MAACTLPPSSRLTKVLVQSVPKPLDVGRQRLDVLFAEPCVAGHAGPEAFYSFRIRTNVGLPHAAGAGHYLGAVRQTPLRAPPAQQRRADARAAVPGVARRASPDVEQL